MFKLEFKVRVTDTMFDNTFDKKSISKTSLLEYFPAIYFFYLVFLLLHRRKSVLHSLNTFEKDVPNKNIRTFLAKLFLVLKLC